MLPATRRPSIRASRWHTGSRLVALRGAFRHTVYAGLFAPQNQCIDDTVNGYLIDGELPSTNATCPVTPSSSEG